MLLIRSLCILVKYHETVPIFSTVIDQRTVDTNKYLQFVRFYRVLILEIITRQCIFVYVDRTLIARWSRKVSKNYIRSGTRLISRQRVTYFLCIVYTEGRSKERIIIAKDLLRLAVVEENMVTYCRRYHKRDK